MLKSIFGLSLNFERTRPRLIIGSPFKQLRLPVTEDLQITMELDRRESLDWSYESGKFDDLSLSFIRANISPQTWFIDVGANQGLFSIAASLFDPQCKVLAIEPDPYSLSKLKKNLELNQLDDTNIRVCPKGVGITPGGKNMELMINSGGNRASSSMVYDQRVYTKKPENETISVNTSTLAEIMEEYEISKVSALKIDIEGFEHKVLSCFFQEANKSLWPGAVILEELPGTPKKLGDSCIELMIRKGYNLVDHLHPDYYFILSSDV